VPNYHNNFKVKRSKLLILNDKKHCVNMIDGDKAKPNA